MSPTARDLTLGIDPGLGRTGYGVVAAVRGNLTFVDAGLITTRPTVSHPQRLRAIYQRVMTLLSTFRPRRIAVERLFFATNVTTAFAVGEARGVVLLAAGQQRVPVVEFTPLQVKQAVTGYGRADKPQVQTMVQRLLHLSQKPHPDDVADALAIAMCAAHTTPISPR